MSHVPSPSRLPRLQFSLRGLLLFMLLVGAGLVVYRCPWEEKEELADGSTVKTHYRRSWNGQAVKHGLETVGAPPRYGWENWYYDGDLRLQRTWTEGGVAGECHFRDGQRHGPYWHNLGAAWVAVRGEFRQDQKHGVWMHESYDQIRREHWQHDLVLGTTWETKTGQRLQSMTLAQGKLTHWNDLPLPQALDKWFDDHSVAPPIRQFMLTRIDDPTELQIRRTEHHELEFQFGEQELIVVWPELSQVLARNLFTGRVFGEVLAEEALTREKSLAYRFNTLCIVPIGPKASAWKDRTGVGDVKFPADSAQEKFWHEPMSPIPHWALSPAGRIRQLLHAEGTNLIEIEVPTWFEAEDLPLTDKVSPARTPRNRRDLLGQYLNLTDCYIEQVENKLVVKSQAEQRQGD